MGLRIKTNMESVTAQNRMEKSRREITDSLEKLSSGQRINRAADDAAGLAMSESMRARIRSLDVAKRNASDGLSYVQVAEGGLNEVTNIVVRMRELTAQAASDTTGQREKAFLDKEFQQLRQEVMRIVEGTEFNGSKLLKATDETRPLQIFVGASNRGQNYQGDFPDIDPEADPDILTIAIDDLSELSSAIETFEDQDVMSIVPPDADGGAQDLGSKGTNEIMANLDTALTKIASYRATLGSFQSRLTSAINNIEISSENLSAANSRIRDVDFATETSKYAQARILTTAGASVLAQANQTPELALSLLR
jgi:flagellin